jgi:hypothetical protein
MVKKAFLAFFAVVTCAAAVALFPLQAPHALADTCKSEDGLTILSIKPWYSGVCKDGTDDVEIKDIPGDIIHIGLNLLSIAIQIAGYAAVGLVIWGGIKYILANGDSGKITAAKTTIQNALIGLLIVLVAVTLVDFITKLYE